jgi:hypothetical protein
MTQQTPQPLPHGATAQGVRQAVVPQAAPTDPNATPPGATRPHRPIGATLWFLWMVGMWMAFFALLFADQLDEIWRSVRDLPFVAEMVLWVLFLPWMLGMAVWTTSWATWIRVALVACFAVGWTLVSIPRRTSKTKPR